MTQIFDEKRSRYSSNSFRSWTMYSSTNKNEETDGYKSKAVQLGFGDVKKKNM